MSAQPAVAEAAPRTAVFKCQLSAGWATVTLNYHISAGHVLYGDQITFTSETTPRFHINAFRVYYRQVYRGEAYWYLRTVVGSNGEPDFVKSGEPHYWVGSDAALFNTAEDGVGNATNGHMQVSMADGVGPTKYCDSPGVLVST